MLVKLSFPAVLVVLKIEKTTQFAYNVDHILELYNISV